MYNVVFIPFDLIFKINFDHRCSTLSYSLIAICKQWIDTKLLRNKTFIMKTTRLTDRDTIAVLRTVENACYM